MKKLVILFLLILGSSAFAEDFSVTLQRAKPYPRPYSVAGMQPAVAPPGGITAVKFWTTGWHSGRNSRPMACFAIPCPRKDGTWWKPVKVDGFCGNPAKGGWLEPCAVAAKTTVALSYTISQESAPVPEQPAYYLPPIQPCAPVLEPWPLPLELAKSGYYHGEKARWESRGRMDIDLSYYKFKKDQVRQKKKELETCDPLQPGDPRIPNPPGPGSTNVIGNPSGGIFNPPPTDPYQPPPANPMGHGTGGMPWDPSPTNPHVADPVN